MVRTSTKPECLANLPPVPNWDPWAHQLVDGINIPWSSEDWSKEENDSRYWLRRYTFGTPVDKILLPDFGDWSEEENSSRYWTKEESSLPPVNKIEIPDCEEDWS